MTSPLSVYGRDWEVKGQGQALIHHLYDRHEARFVESAMWDDDYYITPIERRMFVSFLECATPKAVPTMETLSLEALDFL